MQIELRLPFIQNASIVNCNAQDREKGGKREQDAAAHFLLEFLLSFSIFLNWGGKGCFNCQPSNNEKESKRGGLELPSPQSTLLVHLSLTLSITITIGIIIIISNHYQAALSLKKAPHMIIVDVLLSLSLSPSVWCVCLTPTIFHFWLSSFLSFFPSSFSSWGVSE